MRSGLEGVAEGAEGGREEQLLGLIFAGHMLGTPQTHISAPHCSNPTGCYPLAEMRTQGLREVKSCAQGHTADHEAGPTPVKGSSRDGAQVPSRSRRKPTGTRNMVPSIPGAGKRTCHLGWCGACADLPRPPQGRTPHIETRNTAHYTGIGTTSPYAVTFL